MEFETVVYLMIFGVPIAWFIWLYYTAGKMAIKKDRAYRHGHTEHFCKNCHNLRHGGRRSYKGVPVAQSYCSLHSCSKEEE